MLLSQMKSKGSSKRFQAIFVGYEEHRIGWHVRDFLGKYSFSNDVIFNENMPARLGVPRPIPSSIPDTSTSSSARPLHDHPRIRTNAGKAYDAIMELKQF